jgi:hypothetical protein
MDNKNNNNEEWCEEHEQSKWKDGLKCGGCLDDEEKTCENCGDEYEEHGCSADHCWLTHKCADCDNYGDDVGDGNDENGNELNPCCSECRKKYEE